MMVSSEKEEYPEHFTVCKRWRVLSKQSWSTMKILDKSHFTWNRTLMYHISTTVLRKILIKCGKFVRHIDLSPPIGVPYYFDKSALTIIPKYCPNLTNISVPLLPIDPADLDMLTKHCKKITRLSFGSTLNISDDDLKNVFIKYQNLNYFMIDTNNNILGECLLYLPAQTMRTLKIYCCNRITDFKLSTILARLENLECLDIATDTVIDKTMKVISNHCKNLKKLYMYNKNEEIQHMDMLQFTNLVHLQVLELPQFTLLSDDHLVSVASNCPLITCMDISGCRNVSDAGLTAIATLPKLEYLNISFLSNITDLGLKNIINLKVLECRKCLLITDDGICKILTSSPRLQKLNLGFCHKITNATYESAKQICNSRPSKIILTMGIFKTQIILTDEHELSPFLRIVNT